MLVKMGDQALHTEQLVLAGKQTTIAVVEDGVVWHFFRGPVTGIGGPSGPLRQALEQAGIQIIIH